MHKVIVTMSSGKKIIKEFYSIYNAERYANDKEDDKYWRNDINKVELRKHGT